MVSVDMCEHGWPGSGCDECRSLWQPMKAMPERITAWKDETERFGSWHETVPGTGPTGDEALYVLATTHQRALEALEEAREALLVFAAFSDKAERFVEHKAKFGGTAIFPVKDFRLAHFRKAVEVVALIDSILPGDTP